MGVILHLKNGFMNQRNMGKKLAKVFVEDHVFIFSMIHGDSVVL